MLRLFLSNGIARVLAATIAISSFASAEDAVDFARDIRPILSDKCFFCHGPDEADRRGDLRLDDEEAAKEIAIVPGDIDESELMVRILADDEDVQMPPPESGKKLNEQEIALLKRWIEQGAKWAGHWSFDPITPPEVPDVSNLSPKSWNKNPIDRFIFSKLSQHGFKPSSPAERTTLLRRVTFDLTGLPPTPEEIDAFVADEDSDAYEHVVDRLLASDAYAERMTLAWLDAARYGDTSVMHADGPRDMWPWRDWVIRAYKSNKPFDEFLIEQLAGDFLPDATLDQKLATGFLRNNASSDEGGAFPEELRVEYVVDRVKTTFNVFQGLSAECAQCHSHKYDPISQEEYYGLFAFFNNAADPGMQSRKGNQSPVVRIHTPETQQKLDNLMADITSAETEWKKAQPPTTDVNKWIDACQDNNPATVTAVWHELSSPVVVDDLTAAWESQPIDMAKPIDVTKPVTVDEEQRPWTLREAWKAAGKFRIQSKGNDLHYLTVNLNSSKHLHGEFRLKNAHAFQVWRRGELIHETKFQGKKTVEAKFPLILNEGNNRLLIRLASRHKSGFDLELAFTPKTAPDGILKLAIAAQQSDGDAATDASKKNADSGKPSKLTKYYKQHLWPEGNQRRTAIARLKADRLATRDSSTSCMVMKDLPKIRPTYILDRGEYDSPKKDQVIEPDTPKALGRLGDRYPRNRLGLAKWMTRDDHPLTSRVAMNRYWYLLFGRGLVKTVMDFGGQGSAPTHPELLDWLATDFREHGWDVKRAIKQIVISQTYRQSSKFTEQLVSSDPENLYLARSSRYRLQGDFIRDQALAVSGLLVDKVGGPGVKPYQPPGLWNEVSLNKGLRFKQDHGEALYRRSMYTYWKRSAPHPSMQIFDAPTRETCTVARPRTNTPLQALVTLNDVQFVEASRMLAERMMKEGGGDFNSRLDHGYRLCMARSPQQREIDICQSVYQTQLASFWDDEERALQYLDHGETKRDEQLPLAEHAAWSVIANMLLNLDEVLMRN